MKLLKETKKIIKARQKVYSHPSKDFKATAKIWSAILGIKVTKQQVALCMIGLKISRESRYPSKDNRIDIIGYTYTLEQVNGKRPKKVKK